LTLEILPLNEVFLAGMEFESIRSSTVHLEILVTFSGMLRHLLGSLSL
jgi:hypothetical protein